MTNSAHNPSDPSAPYPVEHRAPNEPLPPNGEREARAVAQSSPTPHLTPEQLATMTPEQKDRWWFENVYQGDRMPQLTWRAVIMGGILGMAMSAANLYTTLSIGWAFGIAITACVLSFVIWNFVRFCSGNNISQMSVLENACMASCASAAGYSTGSTIATMFGALVLLHDVPEGTPLSSVKTWDVTPVWVVTVFTLCTGLMGVFLAIPMKRQMVNHEQLPFPSGTAAAETLRSLYSQSKEALQKAYVLVAGLGAGLLIGFLRVGDDVLDAVRFLKRLFETPLRMLHIPTEIEIGLLNKLYPAMRHPAGFAFEPSALLIAAGMIVGMRISISLVVSSIILYGIAGPEMSKLDARHMDGGAQVVVDAYTRAADGKTEPSAIAADAIKAIEQATQGLNLPESQANAVVRMSKNGAAGTLEGFDVELALMQVDKMTRAASGAGLDGDHAEQVSRRAASAAAESSASAGVAAALGTAEQLARLKGVSPKSIKEAAAEARDAALKKADENAGRVLLDAVMTAAKAQGVDTARVSDAAAKASSASRSAPGRDGADAAQKAAAAIAYDEMENDPAPINDAVRAASATLHDAEDVAAATLPVIVAESGKLGLDTAKITESAESAKTWAEKSEATLRVEVAKAAILREAQAKNVNPAPILAAVEGVNFSAEQNEKHLKDLMQGIVGGPTGAAGTAGAAYANRAAYEAMARAEESAKKQGLSFKKTKEAKDKAFESAKYQPNVIINWGGGTITITRWSLWGGTAVMVFASLTSVALQWRTIVRAFIGVRAGEQDKTGAEMQKIEVPGLWMIAGMLPITIAMVWLQIQAFGVSWYAGLIAVAMSFVLSLVASRATGETDTTPIGAMGKVMQLMFAALAPKNIAANLASAGIAANSASSSADLLTDLKTGYLLGANPRKQFLAQFFGVFFGTVAIVPIWYLMVPTREKLETFALPSTRSWEAVARVLTKGIGELPQSAVYAILIGASIGILLPLIERALPPKARKFMPSATGIGLAWVMPFQNAFSFFVGAVIALLWSGAHKKSYEKFNVATASGLIAGESLMAAALAIIATAVGLLNV